MRASKLPFPGGTIKEERQWKQFRPTSETQTSVLQDLWQNKAFTVTGLDEPQFLCAFAECTPSCLGSRAFTYKEVEFTILSLLHQSLGDSLLCINTVVL